MARRAHARRPPRRPARPVESLRTADVLAAVRSRRSAGGARPVEDAGGPVRQRPVSPRSSRERARPEHSRYSSTRSSTSCRTRSSRRWRSSPARVVCCWPTRSASARRCRRRSIAAELVRREPAARILIVVPAPIVSQWSDELRTRFDLSCRIADRAGLDVAGRETAVGGIAWRQSGIWIATLDFLKQPHVLQGLPGDPWDLVVIDEAHGACGRTERHAAADALLRSARRCLLLTATPHSGDEERYARLMQLGSVPGLPDPLTIFRRTRGGGRIALLTARPLAARCLSRRVKSPPWMPSRSSSARSRARPGRCGWRARRCSFRFFASVRSPR